MLNSNIGVGKKDATFQFALTRGEIDQDLRFSDMKKGGERRKAKPGVCPSS